MRFEDSKGNEIKTVEGNEGDNLLLLAHEYDVDLEGEFVWSMEVVRTAMWERLSAIASYASGQT